MNDRLRKVLLKNVSVEELIEMALNKHIATFNVGLKEASRDIEPLISNMNKEELINHLLDK